MVYPRRLEVGLLWAVVDAGVSPKNADLIIGRSGGIGRREPSVTE